MISEKNRIVYLDYLRVIATFSVIMLHIATQNFKNVDVNSFTFAVFNFYNSIVRWNVPIFVMISGVFFLQREYKIRTLFSKYIFRLIVAFLLWSFLYAIYSTTGKKAIMISTIKGAYHLWFIPMMIGLYMCVPIIKKISDSKAITKYFLGLAVIISFLIPQVQMLINDFAPGSLKEICSAFASTFKNMNFYIVLGYPFYFILGYYLHNIELNKKVRRYIYLLGIVGAVTTFGLHAVLSVKNQMPIANYYGNFNINVLLQAVALFVFFKYNFPDIKKMHEIITKISKYSFGIYLVHALIIWILDAEIKLNSLSFNPLISIPFISCVVFASSLILVILLFKIPFLNKYIV